MAEPIHLDSFSLKDLRLTPQRYEAIKSYYWDHYSYFAERRSRIFPELKEAVSSQAQSFAFSKWQRVVDWRFSLNPLSARGSIINPSGGRFNIGDIDQTRFPQFAALYLAEDRDTAYREKFGIARRSNRKGLSADELNLTNAQSVSIVVIKGEINQVFKIEKTSLKLLFSLLKDIKLPRRLIQRAGMLNIDPMFQVNSVKELEKHFLAPDWRNLPMGVDVPANPQILGQICHASGIEAILYPSKITKKLCLAVYPDNFLESDSYVEIEDPHPEELVYRRLDSQTYHKLI